MDNNNTSNVTDPTHGDQSSDPQAHGATSGSHGEQSLEELQRKLAKLESDNQKYRQERNQLQADTKAAQQVEQERLKAQGDFQKLAEQHAARVKELEPVAHNYSQLSTLIASQIEAQIKDWPEELKVFDPGKDAPVEQRLDWVEKSKPLLEKMQSQIRSQSPGNGPNPKPLGAKDTSGDLKNKLLGSGFYNSF